MTAKKKIEVELPALYQAQHEMVYCAERYSIVEASTKAGKTFACIIWQISMVFSLIGEHWWIAPTTDVSRIAYKRAKKMLAQAKVKVTLNDTRQEITFLNGSLWRFRGSENEDSLYGEDVYSVVIDEASRCKPHTWAAARSLVTSTGGKIRAIGNVRGKRNWFYRLARKANAAMRMAQRDRRKSIFRYTKLTAYDAVKGGVLPASEIEDARQTLPEDIFKALFLAIANDDGLNPFGPEFLEQAKQAVLSSRPTIAYGVDVAKKRDWLVIVGLDDEGQITQLHREKFLSYPQIEELIVRTCGHTPTYVDQSGVGEAVFDYCVRRMDNLYGFVFTKSSKLDLYDDLARQVQHGRIGVLDGLMMSEFEAMEIAWDEGRKHYESTADHDDTVSATALANLAKKKPPKQNNVEPGVLQQPVKSRAIGAGGW